MKPRHNSNSDKNRLAAASLLADLEEEYSESPRLNVSSSRPVQAHPAESINEQSGIDADSNEKKLETNRGQSGDKGQSKSRTKWRQTEDKVETVCLQTRDTFLETEDKVETQPRTLSETKWRQTEDKVETNPTFSSLVGLQRKIVVFLFEMTSAARSSSTGPVTLEHLSYSCETSVSSVKKTLQRLETKSFFKRIEFKNGRGGWTKYELHNEVFQELLRNGTRDKVETNRGQTEDKVETQPRTQPRTSLSSSSSNLLIKESTTTQPNSENLDWMSLIDFSPVQSSGITRSVLSRCVELYPNLASRPEALEQLVFRFGEYLKMPQTKIKNARGFFIGLAEQLSKGQTPLDHIESPEEQLLKQLVETQETAKARRLELESKAMDFECETWLEQLSENLRSQLAPENHVVKPKSPAQDRLLKEHFRMELWPKRRNEILESLKAK